MRSTSIRRARLLVIHQFYLLYKHSFFSVKRVFTLCSYTVFRQWWLITELGVLFLHWPGRDTLVFRGRMCALHAPHPQCHLILASLYLFLCTHILPISFLLLMFDWYVHAFIISNFSEQHKSQNLFPGAYLLFHFFMIDHSLYRYKHPAELR